MKVSYNGVVLQRVLTTGWDESIQYDSSGMNMIGNSITLSFEGTILANSRDSRNREIQKESDEGSVNVNLQNLSSSSTSSIEKMYERLNVCLRQLSIPRGSLKVYDDVYNKVVFSAFPDDDSAIELTETERRNVDINGGPKPKNIRVVQLVGEYARISITFEICKIRCLGGETYGIVDGDKLGDDPTVGFVVSNRCWTEETIDANFYTTRTFSGSLRISSPMKSVHFYRSLYYPPLEDGFRRESVRFSESENGLTLSYSVTDKQVRCAAPYPATAFNGNVSYSVINGADMRLQMNLTMIGRPDAPKDALTARALQAVLKKIEEFSKNSSGFQENFTISENLGDPPSVTVEVGYRLFSSSTESVGGNNANSAIAQVYASNIGLIGKPLEFEEEFSDGNTVHIYKRTKSATPNAYGYDVYNAYDSDEKATDDKSERNAAMIGFIKCLATAPCALMSVKLAAGDVSGENIEELTSTKVVRDKEGLDYTSQNSGVVKEAVTYPYSYYKSDITYYTDFARVSLPRAFSVATTINGDITGTIDKTNFTASCKDADGNEVGTITATVSGNVISGVATTADGGRKGAVNGFISGDATSGSVTGSLSGTTLSGTIKESESVSKKTEGSDESTEEKTGSIAANIVWARDKSAEAKEGANTRVVTLARSIPKAVVVVEAERYNRLPEFPDPETIVTTTTPEDAPEGYCPIVFTCVKCETQLCEPQAARNNGGVSYSAVARYEYVMSRPHRQGDEVWLLMNPTFASSRYYPEKVNTETGEKEDDAQALTTLYNGFQLTHDAPEPETEEENTEENAEEKSDESSDETKSDDSGKADETKTDGEQQQ